jgi:hypothetical protein
MTAHTATADGESTFAAHEHREVAVGVAHIQETVDRACELTSEQLSARLLHALAWLRHDLRPHLAWEEAWLYPELNRIAGTPWATRSARFEHRQIETRIANLEAESAHWSGHTTPRTNAAILARLGAIGAVIGCHLEREEGLLMPLLDEASETGG